MKPFVLGLDLGTNSIGWSLLGLDEHLKPDSVVDCGVRIFQEAVEAKTRTPKNHARRAARALRRLVARRRLRREQLRGILVTGGLLSETYLQDADETAFNQLGDPYTLRKRGLDQKLSLAEFARVLMHFCKRRGFQSNRKTKGDDEGKVKTAITQLGEDIKAAGCRTLGEYLASQSKKRERYTSREMYQAEFEVLWQAQQCHHAQALTPELKARAHNAIFFQRPLKLQKHLVGKCSFEPDRKRAARAILEAQRARIWQDLNHLEIKNPLTRAYRKLRADEKAKLHSLLKKQKSVSWGKAKKTLGLHENEFFNLEEGKKTELIGNRTAYSLREALGTGWDEMPLAKQQALITDMLTIDNESGFLRRMRDYWKFDDVTAQKLAQTELEPGYARLSSKVLAKILPHLEAGLRYDEACTAAGYNHASTSQSKTVSRLDEPPHLRNPVVQKALYEARRVVNAIIREYGRPQLIRVEMARDMKLSKREKDNAQKQNKANEKLNKEAADFAAEQGYPYARRDMKIKYRLWKECNCICPYTGRPISQAMLFGPEVDIEHILPYQLSLDDSYMNKTLCLADENRSIKRNRTPYEAYWGDEKKYLEILMRVKTLPWSKRRKFEQKEVKTDEFVARQLTDTRYICVEVKNYLASLGIPVEVSKGQATANLRWLWGLDAILHPDGVLEKNRADHRHHAIDAIVIALTTRGVFMKLSHRYETGFALDKPWATFNRDVKERIDAIVVSHASARKISGALHEATAYGAGFIWKTDKNGERIKEPIYVYRKPLDDKFMEKQVTDIRDEKIAALVLERLRAYGGDAKKAFGDPNTPLFHVDGKTPIRSVRIVTRMNPATVHTLRDRNGQSFKHVKYGNNHHVVIIEHVESGKRKGIFVTAMEAARRARITKEPIVQKVAPWKLGTEEFNDGWRFVMSLSVNDLIRTEAGGESRLYRVQLLDSSNGNICFRESRTATLDDSTTRLFKNANTLRCEKLVVDAIGRITAAND